jgi:hypothetical protein
LIVVPGRYLKRFVPGFSFLAFSFLVFKSWVLLVLALLIRGVAGRGVAGRGVASSSPGGFRLTRLLGIVAGEL